MYFLCRKSFSKSQALKYLAIGILGGLQGVIGWWMVKSGLVNEPRVSHIRLTIHFGVALLTLGLLFWSAMRIKYAVTTERKLNTAMSILFLFITLLSGAWVAGQDAGLVYNHFPKMGGYWLPPELFFYQPIYLDLLYNPVTAQFLHRILALSAFSMVIILGVRACYHREGGLYAYAMMMFAFMQVCLGIATLLTHVNIILAAFHQFIAVCLFISFLGFHATRAVFKISRASSAVR